MGNQGYPYEGPPFGPGSIGQDAIDTFQLVDLAVKTGKIDNLAVTTAKINTYAVTEPKIDTGAVWTAKCDAAWGYRETMALSIPEFPPGVEIVHDLGYVPAFVSLTKLSGGSVGTEAGNVFLTSRTMSSIFIFAEAGTSGIFVHWWVMR